MYSLKSLEIQKFDKKKPFKNGEQRKPLALSKTKDTGEPITNTQNNNEWTNEKLTSRVNLINLCK